MSRLSQEAADLVVKCPQCKKDVPLGRTTEDYDSSDAKTFCYCPTCERRLATVDHLHDTVRIYENGHFATREVILSEA